MLEIIYANKDSYAPLWGFSPHRHEYYQLLYILSGTGAFQIDGQKLTAGEYDCILVRPGQEHEFIADHKGEVTMFDMKFVLHGETVSYCQRLQNKTHLESKAFIRCLEDVYKEAVDKKPFFMDIVNSRFKQALIYLIREGADDEGEINPDTDSFSEVSKKLDEFLRQNYGEFLTLDDIASKIGYSKIYLCQAFKKDCGMTVMQYLYDIRLDKAKGMLINTDDSLKAIAFGCGFRSLPHFNRTFSNRFNVSPGKFRRDQKRRLNLPILLGSGYEQDLKIRRYITTGNKK